MIFIFDFVVLGRLRSKIRKIENSKFQAHEFWFCKVSQNGRFYYSSYMIRDDLRAKSAKVENRFSVFRDAPWSLGELPKSCFQGVDSWLLTFTAKSQRESKKRVVRAPENIRIIEKRKENKEKLDTHKSSNPIRPTTLLNDEFRVSPNIYKTNLKSKKHLF